METQEQIQLDVGKLENILPNGDGSLQAACPMCRQEGSDKTGNHLRVYPSRAFHCAKYKNDKYHNRGILMIAGTAAISDLPSPTTNQPSLQIEEIYDEECLSRLIKDYSYWNNRGISSETMMQFEGGIAIKGKQANRYVFPMRDRNGKLHGFTGRYIKPMNNYDIPRWKHVGLKENWVFDRTNTINSIVKQGIVILVEGIGCALALREVGIKSVVPIFGVVPSSQLFSLLISLNPKKIVVSLNNELDNKKAQLNGNTASNRIVGILQNFFSDDKILLRLPDKKDWLDSPLEDRLNFKKEIFN
jgi:hypothetical protein